MGNTFLQASVNPYITILGPMESAAKRMSYMGIANKLAWPIAPLFLALIIGKDVENVSLTDINIPFYIIIGVFVLLGVLALLAKLPEVKAVGEDEDSDDVCLYAESKTSIWQFPHLLLGVLALFLYVGVETVSLGTLVDYATSLGLANAEYYAWIAPIAMVLGYICGAALIPKYLSQATALKICAVLALFGSLMVVLSPEDLSIYFIAFMALGCSLMWPALWPLAMTDLGKFTKAGSSLMVIAIVGGALIPTAYGFMKDAMGAQAAYWICVPCFLYILYYGLKGHKIRTK
jgi:glucose/galactose transporter